MDVMEAIGDIVTLFLCSITVGIGGACVFMFGLNRYEDALGYASRWSQIMVLAIWIPAQLFFVGCFLFCFGSGIFGIVWLLSQL